MNRLEIKGLLLLTLALGLFLGLGSLSLLSYQAQSEHTQNLLESARILEHAHAYIRNSQKSSHKNTLQNISESLQPKFRADAIHQLLTSSSKANLMLLVDSESRFQKHSHTTISNYEQRTVRFGWMALGLATLTFLGAAFWNRNRIYTPLKKLNDRMKDFLNNRYSYKFVTPDHSELGQLQSTFNLMAQKVLDQIRELQGLDKAKSEFLSIASHELRTPLTSIKGSLSLLKGGVAGELNSETLNLLGIAMGETERLIRLINELLDLAKIESGSFGLRKAWTSLSDLTQQAASALEGYASPAEVNIQVDLTHDIDLNIDRDRILQVIANLASNAIKYSPKGGTIYLKGEVLSDQTFRFSVIDEGPGISPEDQALIFEKFRQATGPENPLVEGTGLGLAIAKALVEEHGGHIGVESTPGSGSCFYFALPDWKAPQNRSHLEAS